MQGGVLIFYYSLVMFKKEAHKSLECAIHDLHRGIGIDSF